MGFTPNTAKILDNTIGLTKGNFRLLWKNHEHEYPVLAKLARNILAVSASRSGVERLFNCARDVCHYRRGKLKPHTIISANFDFEQSKLGMIKE